jgi:uncharacterized protein
MSILPSIRSFRDIRTGEAHREQRIAELDVMRGLALFGMILVHFHQGFRLTTPELEPWPGESLSEWVIWIGIEQKSAATFALLFGVGFAILLRRATTDGRPIVPFYVRRLTALAVCGIVVEALTGYEILLRLALWGLPLLLVRAWSARALLVLAIASAVAWPAVNVGIGVFEWIAGEPAHGAIGTAVVEPSTYAEEVQRRLVEMRAGYLSWRTLIPGSTFALYIVGLLALRRGVFDDPLRHARLIVGAIAFGLASWLAFWLLPPHVPEAWTAWSTHAWPIRYGMGLMNDQWLALAYAGGLMLLCAVRVECTSRLAVLGAVGRVALTSYVLQAGAVYWLRSEFGLGLQLRPAYRVAAAVLLFAVLAVGARAWLRRFAYGPLEWAWRAASHLRWSPLRVRAGGAAAGRPLALKESATVAES